MSSVACLTKATGLITIGTERELMLRIFLITICTMLLVSHISAADEWVLVKDEVIEIIEHPEKARGAGGEKKWSHDFKKNGWALYDFAIHEDSRRGPGTEMTFKKDGDVLYVNGKTVYEQLTGKGGNYKAEIRVTFVRAYKIEGKIKKEQEISKLGLPDGLSAFIPEQEGGERKAKAAFALIDANLRKNTVKAELLSVSSVALDASGGKGDKIYLNDKPDSSNINHQFRLDDIGGGKFIIKTAINGSALDANNGGNLYWHAKPDANQPNHCWKIEEKDGYTTIVSVASGKALDCGGNADKLYQNDKPSRDNICHLWKIERHKDFVLLIPKKRKND
jgi:Ricin-type beta-trefoil lectin domain-like